jgi:hypothetical protein
MVRLALDSPRHVSNYLSFDSCDRDEPLFLGIVESWYLVAVILVPSAMLMLENFIPQKGMNVVLIERPECFDCEVD